MDSPQTDRAMAERFLTLLAEGEPVTFQTFSDRDETKVKRVNGEPYDPLAHIRHGSLEHHGRELTTLNRGAAGVFIAVNATDGRGRTAKNVVRVRALFGDLDGTPLPKTWGLEPHLIVESSPGRFHAYWLVADCPLERFPPLQKAIATKFGGDPSVHDLPRVMRLPGFLHQKNEPFLTHIIHENPVQPYALSEIVSGLGLELTNGESRTGPKLGIGHDRVLQALSGEGLLRGPLHGKPGAWGVLCPWRGAHTTGDGGACYFEAHTNGYAGAAFRCLHAHCVGRTIRDLKAFLGWGKGEDIPPDDDWQWPEGAAENPEGDSQSELVVRCVADVETTAVRWLWKDRIALGKITFLVGDPDEGKSCLTTAMAAHVTAGTPWPDGAPCDKGSVILISAEDDISDTIRPRLEVCGAELAKVRFIETVNFCKRGKKGERLFSVQEDLHALGKALDKLGDVRLVVIDPISAFLGECDSHVNAEVRGLMGPFAKLAAKHNAAFLAISHLNKGLEGNALYRVTGSLAFVALARAAFLLTHDKENPERRLLLRIKNNLSALRTGLAFSLVGSPHSGQPVVAWEPDPVDMTANDALMPAVKEKGETKLESAEKWLREVLADGPVLQEIIKADAEGMGISYRTLNSAKADMGIKSRKQTFSGKWEWFLPTPGECLHPSTEPAPDKAAFEECRVHPSAKTKRDADLKAATDKDSAEECNLHPSNETNKNAAPSEGCKHSGGVGDNDYEEVFE